MNRKLLSLLLAALLVLGISGCGRSADSSSAESNSYWSEPAEEEYAKDYDEGFSSDTVEAPAAAPAGGGQSVYTAENVKLIRTAWLGVETKSYDAACTFIERTVKELGGYFGNIEQYQGGYYYSSSRNVSYTARVPAAQYDAFMAAISGDTDCSVVSKNESTEDVGLQYADLETHIGMLNTKLQRLNELMAQAKDMEDIIALESAIAEAEYELSSYQSDINRYDNLIGFATITINVEEVVEYSPAAEKGFLERLVDSFASGWDNFVWGVQDVILFAASNIFGLIVLVILIVVIVRLVHTLRRRSAVKKAAKKEQSPKASAGIPVQAAEVPAVPEEVPEEKK